MKAANILSVYIGLSLSAAAADAAQLPTGPRDIPTPIYGVTVDDAAGPDLEDVVAALGGLTQSLAQAKRPSVTTRIVYAEDAPAASNRDETAALRKVGYVMGQVLDSSYVKNITAAAYLARTQDYVSTLGDLVDLWEIGNEVNGDWLGPTPEVAAKVVGAYDIVKGAGKKTALTLYFHKEGCVKDPSLYMIPWAQANIPDRMKQGLDAVLVSYYEDDCAGPAPDWQDVFRQLSEMFPNARVGFGECGTEKPEPEHKAEMIARYYKMRVNVPRFAGGYFWWYFKQDMVPATKPLWKVIETAMTAP